MPKDLYLINLIHFHCIQVIIIRHEESIGEGLVGKRKLNHTS